MRRMLHPALFLCLIFSAISSTTFAAEVKNLTTHYHSDQLSIEYDLLGSPGEKKSGVEVLLIINGNRYSPHMLSISGDFGRSIALGKNRQIIWNHPQDFPEGLDTKFKCIVNAVSDSSILDEESNPSEGYIASFYALNKQTVTETRTRLMWTRNANIFTKPMKHSDAEKMIRKLNQERYAGYNDWRMPTRDDFEGLVFFGRKAGWGHTLGHYLADYLTACGFTRVQSCNYWTSTAAEVATDQFFTANTWNGFIRPLAKTNYYYLWPVRSAQ